MKRKIVWLVVSCLMALSLLMASCAPAAVEEEEAAPPPVEEVAPPEEEEAPLPVEEEAAPPEEEEETPPAPEVEEEVTPPEEESTMPILTDGTHRWRLKATTFGDKKIKFLASEPVETSEGWVVFQAEFENLSGVSLIKAWYQETKGGETSMIEIFSLEGMANMYVIDSQGSMYPAVILSRSQITFVVPYDGHGFTLHFLDYAPIELGY